MSFVLSKRSESNLLGVNAGLVATVRRAIAFTRIDFGVSEGLRTIQRQKELVAKGASKTMNSRHISGNAVDLVAYIDGRVSWELNLYDDIADAMRAAAKEIGITVRWGAAWNVPDITKWNGSMESAMMNYVDTRRKEGKRPFIDAPHFEIPE